MGCLCVGTKSMTIKITEVLAWGGTKKTVQALRFFFEKRGFFVPGIIAVGDNL